jgi:hypothetical protein
MRIAKPMLLVTTPIGLAFGLYEAWRLAGGLVFLMAALVSLIGVAMASVVLTVPLPPKENRSEGADCRCADHRRREPRAGALRHVERPR